MNNNFEDRLNLGTDVHELKLGNFASNSQRETFHTIKYDFKPASVDVSKSAKLDVGSNLQVTVTVPHLDGSGVPNTLFKGPSRDYSKKDCLLIINRETNEITLERLKSNIVLKKTRNETPSKPLPPKQSPATASSSAGLENSTARQSSKTKVSTGVRKNAPISFVPKHSPIEQHHNSSPNSYQKSPSSAPQWNANNPLQTLPSFPIIGDDYEPINTKPSANALPSNLTQPSHASSKVESHKSLPETVSGAAFREEGVAEGMFHGVGEMTSSGSSESDSNSSDSGSDSDSDDPPPQPKQNFSNGAAILNEDLRLSDSNSDSDD